MDTFTAVVETAVLGVSALAFFSVIVDEIVPLPKRQARPAQPLPKDSVRPTPVVLDPCLTDRAANQGPHCWELEDQESPEAVAA